MNLKTILIIAGCSYIFPATAQERTMELSLDETVKLAKLQSPDAQTARHSFRSAYWNYKYYRANYLPALSLTSDPNLNRAINKVTLGDGTVKFVEQNMLSTDLTLNLTQNIHGPAVHCLWKRQHNEWISSATTRQPGRLHLLI